MKLARRKRFADPSSSIATIRTGSKPSWPSTFQPLSLSICDLYLFEVPLGKANHTMASPSALRASLGARASICSGVVTNARENVTCFAFFRSRMTSTPSSAASWLSKLFGESRTTICLWSLSFSFANTVACIHLELSFSRPSISSLSVAHATSHLGFARSSVPVKLLPHFANILRRFHHGLANAARKRSREFRHVHQYAINPILRR